MTEQELLCKTFGGMTDDQAREELKRMGIVVIEEALDPNLYREKIWKRQVIRLCDYPKERYVRRVKPSKLIEESFQEYVLKVAVPLEVEEFKMHEMGYSHWVDDEVRGEPGNGYWKHFRWFYWVEAQGV